MSHEHERIEAFGWIQRMATLAPLKHDRSLYYPMKAYSQESEGYCRITSFFSVPWQWWVQDYFGDFFSSIFYGKKPQKPSVALGFAGINSWFPYTLISLHFLCRLSTRGIKSIPYDVTRCKYSTHSKWIFSMSRPIAIFSWSMRKVKLPPLIQMADSLVQNPSFHLWNLIITFVIKKLL